MIADDFFKSPGAPWDIGGAGTPTFNIQLVNALRLGPIEGRTDVEAAIALATLVNDELLTYGTKGGEKLTDDQLSTSLTALRAVCRRLGVSFEPPFRNFTTFRTHWERNGAYGSWHARRTMVAELFEPLHLALVRLEEKTFDALADPVSPRAEVGWPVVDEEIKELRRRFQVASSPQDYRALGTNCVGVIEALGRTVYDPTRHLRDGETVPPVDKTKQRLERYIEDAVPGEPNTELRGLARKVIDLAHHVKHSGKTRRQAGIAADSVILLANMLRRLHQDP